MCQDGRKTKLNPERAAKICDLLSKGNTRRASAYASGVTYESMRSWLKRAEECESGIYVEFAEAVQLAEAQAEINAVSVVTQAGFTNWTAAAWWLERKFPDDWAKTEKVKQEVTGADRSPIAFVNLAPLGEVDSSSFPDQSSTEG